MHTKKSLFGIQLGNLELVGLHHNELKIYISTIQVQRPKVLIVFIFPQETRVRGAHEEVSDRFPVQRMPAGVSDSVRPDLRHRPEDLQQRLFLGNGELPVSVVGQQTVSRRLRAAHRRAQKLFVLILHNNIVYFNIIL